MTDENLDKEDQLIKNAVDVFMTYGIKSVTMDDIAKHLRVSKKTIYRFVKDKSELVMKCVRHDYNILEKKVEAIAAKNLNAIDENFEITYMILEELRNIHPSIFYDLEKYYPKAMSIMLDMRHEFIAEVMRKNMDRGIEEGVYREDVNVEIMTQLWVMRINVIFNPSVFNMDNFHPKDVYLEMFIHHIRGIASEKGLKKLEKHLQTKTNF